MVVEYEELVSASALSHSSRYFEIEASNEGLRGCAELQPSSEIEKGCSWVAGKTTIDTGEQPPQTEIASRSGFDLNIFGSD